MLIYGMNKNRCRFFQPLQVTICEVTLTSGAMFNRDKHKILKHSQRIKKNMQLLQESQPQTWSGLWSELVDSAFMGLDLRS